MDELKRNGSGYYDPTAYKALQKIEREEEEMEEIKVGEIWEIESSGKETVAIVLVDHGSYCTILSLADEPRENRSISIPARGVRYADPGFISYKFKAGFKEYIRTTTKEEFEDVFRKVLKAIGYSYTGDDRAKNEENIMLKAVNNELRQKLSKIEERMKNNKDSLVNGNPCRA